MRFSHLIGGFIVSVLFSHLGFASEDWGDWGGDRGTDRANAIHAVVTAAASGIYSQTHDSKSVANYVFSERFFLGDGANERSIKVQALSRVTRTPLSESQVRYTIQPLRGNFASDIYGGYRATYAPNANVISFDRNTKDEHLSGVEIPPAILDSINAAVANAGGSLDLNTTQKWQQFVPIGIGEAARFNPTDFEVRRLSGGEILIEYSVGDFEIGTNHGDLKEGRARGFVIVDKGFNVVFASGMSYEGFLKTSDGKLVKISGHKTTSIEGIRIDPASTRDLPEFITGELSSTVDLDTKDFPSDDASLPLYEVYAEIDPVLANWSINAQSVGEHRTNIAWVVGYAAVRTFDSLVTVAVNAYGNVTDNPNLAEWKGPIASALRLLADAVTNNNQPKHLGLTVSDWAGIAVEAVGLAGPSRLLQVAAKKTMQFFGIVSDINTLGSLIGDAKTVFNALRDEIYPASTRVVTLLPATNGTDFSSTQILPVVTMQGFAPNRGVVNINAKQFAATHDEFPSLPFLSDSYVSRTPIESGYIVLNGQVYDRPYFTGNTQLLPSESLAYVGGLHPFQATGSLSDLNGLVNVSIYPFYFVLTNSTDSNRTWTKTASITLEGQNLGLHSSNFGIAVLANERPFHTHAAWAYGTAPTMNMPYSGVATYSGLMNCIADSQVGGGGAASFSVSFTNARVAGVLTHGYVGVTGVTQISASIAGNGFTGTASTAGLSGLQVTDHGFFNQVADIPKPMAGNVSGHFYGGNAEELVGAFSLMGGGHVVVGSFGAKKN